MRTRVWWRCYLLVIWYRPCKIANFQWRIISQPLSGMQYLQGLMYLAVCFCDKNVILIIPDKSLMFPSGFSQKPLKPEFANCSNDLKRISLPWKNWWSNRNITNCAAVCPPVNWHRYEERYETSLFLIDVRNVLNHVEKKRFFIATS